MGLSVHTLCDGVIACVQPKRKINSELCMKCRRNSWVGAELNAAPSAKSRLSTSFAQRRRRWVLMANETNANFSIRTSIILNDIITCPVVHSSCAFHLFTRWKRRAGLTHSPLPLCVLRVICCTHGLHCRNFLSFYAFAFSAHAPLISSAAAGCCKVRRNIFISDFCL